MSTVWQFRAAVRLLYLLAAMIAFVGVVLPGDFNVHDSWDVAIGSLHAAPFLIVVLASIGWKQFDLSVLVAATCAGAAETVLMFGVSQSVQSDAQGGLLYVFVTPVATAAIAIICPSAGALMGRRRAEDG